MITLSEQRASHLRGGLTAMAVLLATGVFVPCSAGAAAPSSTATASASSASPPAIAPASSSVDISYKVTKPPQYPVSAMIRGEQGLVMIDVKVDASGHVLSADVDPRGTNAAKDLQDAAVAFVKAWQFTPGVKDGQPTGGIVVVPVSFGIADTCSKGYLPVGRPVSGYNCIPNSSHLPDKPGQCLRGFTAHAIRNKAYSCIVDSSAESAPAASADN